MMENQELIRKLTAEVAALRNELNATQEDLKAAIEWSKGLEVSLEAVTADLQGVNRSLGDILGHTPTVPIRRLQNLLARDGPDLVSRVYEETLSALRVLFPTFANQPGLRIVSLGKIIEAATAALRRRKDIEPFVLLVDALPELALDPSWMTRAAEYLLAYALGRTSKSPKELRFGSVLSERGWVCYLTDSTRQVEIDIPDEVRRWRHTYSIEFATFCRIVIMHQGMVWKQPAEPGRGVICFLLPKRDDLT